MASLKRKAGAELAASIDAKKAKQPSQQSSLMSFFAAPKSGGGGGSGGSGNGSGSTGPGKAPSSAFPSSSPPIAAFRAEHRFDKAKWVATLTKEQQQLLKLEIDTLGESWLAVLKDELTTPSFLDLKRFLSRQHEAGHTIFPPPQDVYSWSRYTPFGNVKVVIIGQDPYHNVGQAHGLAFSVKPPVPPPPSLKNMYIALKKDYPEFQPPPAGKGGLLTPWAERGVLLLNTCLTVRAHDANSHSNHGWERFTQRIIELVAQRRTRGVVFMAWGSPAAKRVVKIDGTRHLVLRSVHPSPLSAHRGFFDCRHFRTANEWLMKRYGPSGEVDWSLQPGTSTIEGVPVDAETEESRATGAKESKEPKEPKEAEPKEPEEPKEPKEATEPKKELSENMTDNDDDDNKTDVEEESPPPTTATDIKVTVSAEDEKENVAVTETKADKINS